MPYDLKGRNVLVTGGSRGLGALICEKFAAQGCNIAVNYVSNEDKAQEVVKKVEGFGVKAIVIQGVCYKRPSSNRPCCQILENMLIIQDAGIEEDNIRLVKQTTEAFGGLDIIIANAGWTRFAKFGDLNDLSNEEWDKCWRCNVMHHLQLMQTAAPIFNANDDGGVYLITSSIAGVSAAGSSLGYSVTKAAGLQLMKCLAATQGPKIRVNAILPGLLLTDWGLRYSEERIAKLKDKALLKQETLLEDCAAAYVYAASNSSMTGQEIIVDSGLAAGPPPP